jgi:hypothetical protein
MVNDKVKLGYKRTSKIDYTAASREKSLSRWKMAAGVTRNFWFQLGVGLTVAFVLMRVYEKHYEEIEIHKHPETYTKKSIYNFKLDLPDKQDESPR